MSTTRRTILGSALAAPLLAHFATVASAEDKWGTISNGWVEIRWTPQAQAQLDRLGATVDAIAPAKLIKDAEGTAVRLPVRSGAGDPALTNLPQAQGSGVLDGGLVLRTPSGEFRITKLESLLQAGQASAKCSLNGMDIGVQSVFRCGLDEGRLAAEPVPAGRPVKIRLNGVPVRPTKESLAAFASAFGSPAFTADTVLAHVNAEGVYTPPRR